LQAQIDEGGNPFGNIPKDVELCFDNSRMLQEREDQFQLKPGVKVDSTPKGRAPLRAVKVGSNFSNRENIISMSTLRLQLLELLLPENPIKNTANKRADYRRVVPDPGPGPGDTEDSRNLAKFKAVEEAGRRIYMAISGHRTPQHRHVENHEDESNFNSRDTDPEELVDQQSRINASYHSNLEAEFELAATQIA